MDEIQTEGTLRILFLNKSKHFQVTLGLSFVFLGPKLLTYYSQNNYIYFIAAVYWTKIRLISTKTLKCVFKRYNNISYHTFFKCLIKNCAKSGLFAFFIFVVTAKNLHFFKYVWAHKVIVILFYFLSLSEGYMDGNPRLSEPSLSFNRWIIQWGVGIIDPFNKIPN